MTMEEYKEKYPDAETTCKETREKISKNHADMSGKNNPFYGREHTKETKKTIGKQNRENMKKAWEEGKFDNHAEKLEAAWERGAYDDRDLSGKNNPIYGRNRELSEEWREKMSESQKEWWDNAPKEIKEKYSKLIRGKNNPMHSKESKKKMLKSLMERPTKPEKRVIKVIKRYNLPFKYTGDGGKIIGKLNPDFVHNDGSKKVIEIFGEVYHNPEKSFRENIPWYQQEFGRKTYFSQMGYDCLILWESDIRKMSDEEIASKIKEFME